MHCDVVVTDKQMADLLTRRFQTKAIVLRQLSDLQPALETLDQPVGPSH
jgi:hypothetical protein